MYNIGSKIEVRRAAGDMLEIKMGNESAKVFTEDLAALVRQELPKDRAEKLFAEIEDKEIRSGEARVTVAAKKNIKKGEYVSFKININRYLDSQGHMTGVRTNKFGFIY